MRQAGFALWQNVLKDPLSSAATDWMAAGGRKDSGLLSSRWEASVLVAATRSIPSLGHPRSLAGDIVFERMKLPPEFLHLPMQEIADRARPAACPRSPPPADGENDVLASTSRRRRDWSAERRFPPGSEGAATPPSIAPDDRRPSPVKTVRA